MFFYIYQQCILILNQIKLFLINFTKQFLSLVFFLISQRHPSRCTNRSLLPFLSYTTENEIQPSNTQMYKYTH